MRKRAGLNTIIAACLPHDPTQRHRATLKLSCEKIPSSCTYCVMYPIQEKSFLQYLDPSGGPLRALAGQTDPQIPD